MRVHNQVANRQHFVIRHKIRDVTDLSVPGLNRAAGYIFCAAQMRVITFFMTSGFGPSPLSLRVSGSAPHIRAVPVYWPTIERVILHLVLSGDWFVGVQGWTVLNLLLGQIDGNGLVIRPSRIQCVRRNQNLPAAKPADCIGDKISNRPTLVIEVELFSLADLSVARAQCVTP